MKYECRNESYLNIFLQDSRSAALLQAGSVRS